MQINFGLDNDDPPAKPALLVVLFTERNEWYVDPSFISTTISIFIILWRYFPHHCTSAQRRHWPTGRQVFFFLANNSEMNYILPEDVSRKRVYSVLSAIISGRYEDVNFSDDWWPCQGHYYWSKPPSRPVSIAICKLYTRVLLSECIYR